MTSIFQCRECGHLEFEQMPGLCPVCNSSAESYFSSDQVFEESSAKSKEAAVKHVPVITVARKCGLIPEHLCLDIIVRIGATLHSMESADYIQFMDCYIDNAHLSRIQFSPGVFPAGVFHIKSGGRKVTVVEKCITQGYWKAEINV